MRRNVSGNILRYVSIENSFLKSPGGTPFKCSLEDVNLTSKWLAILHVIRSVDIFCQQISGRLFVFHRLIL